MKQKRTHSVVWYILTSLCAIVLMAGLLIYFVDVRPKQKIFKLISPYETEVVISSPAEEFLSFANEVVFFYTCGTNIPQEEIENSFYQFLAFLPRTTREFASNGGRIILADVENFDKLIKLYGRDKNTTGFFFKDVLNNKKPTILIKCNESVFSGPELHEMAHYMDDVYGFSKTDDFKTYFRLYAKDYSPSANVVDGYQASSEKEFFAILVDDLCTAPLKAIPQLPEDLFKFMSNVFMTVEERALQ